MTDFRGYELKKRKIGGFDSAMHTKLRDIGETWPTFAYCVD